MQEIAFDNNTSVSALINNYLEKIAYSDFNLKKEIRESEKQILNLVLDDYKQIKEMCHQYASGKNEVTFKAMKYSYLEIIVNLSKLKRRFSNKDLLKLFRKSCDLKDKILTMNNVGFERLHDEITIVIPKYIAGIQLINS